MTRFLIKALIERLLRGDTCRIMVSGNDEAQSC
jgi:hypothetical protein